MNEFAIRLKELRKAKKLTQTDLAIILHLSHGAVAMWETNKRQPDNETLSKLADFFGVTVDYLLGREDRITTPQNPIQEYTKEEKQLLSLITQMTDEEVEELSNFVDYIISKRK